MFIFKMKKLTFHSLMLYVFLQMSLAFFFIIEGVYGIFVARNWLCHPTEHYELAMDGTSSGFHTVVEDSVCQSARLASKVLLGCFLIGMLGLSCSIWMLHSYIQMICRNNNNIVPVELQSVEVIDAQHVPGTDDDHAKQAVSAKERTFNRDSMDTVVLS